MAAVLVADRVALALVEHRLASRLSCPGALSGDRGVRIGGFPFLTQIASGRLRAVTVAADAVATAPRLADPTVTFHDLRISSRLGLLVGRGRPSVTVGSITLAGTLRLGAVDGRGDAGSGIGSGSGSGADPGVPWPLRLRAAGSAGTGPMTSRVLADAGLPPGARLEAVSAVPDGLRLVVTVPGSVLTAAAAAAGDGGAAVRLSDLLGEGCRG
ncbi:LmeA family phospholipid-binding protein [Parafrankia elaeagni]|uniref:LmeA family phospholipid-binding protein n=1 Tax=Parafrankia elaeagni TaxID=222534 RepID=UPI00036A6955|nr:LmeA family phospholipid-binding protein [Parafrankia elaeagni]